MQVNSFRRVVGLAFALLFSITVYGEPALLLQNIAVIDGRGNGVQPQRDVLIEQGRITRTAVSGMLSSLPDDLTIIRGEGLTVMPGLIDMHVHIGGVDFDEDPSSTWQSGKIDQALQALLYAGVTAVHDLDNDQEQILRLRDEVAAGDRLGPSIFAVGKNFDRLTSVDSVFELPTKGVEQIQADLDIKQKAGIETIKLYAGLSPWSARHIMHEAKKRDMQGIADFWCSNLSRDTFEITGVDGYAHGACKEIDSDVALYMRLNNKFVIPTLVLFDTMGGHRAYRERLSRGYLNNPLVVDVMGKTLVKSYYDNFARIREFYEDGEQSLYATQLFGDLKGLLPDNMKNVKMLLDEDVLVGMGTDAAFPPGTWYGESMHYELELYVLAGVDPLKAIQAATYNNAIILRREADLGSIESGKIADLLIVRGDPASNISDTREIEYVIKAGRVLDRKAMRNR